MKLYLVLTISLALIFASISIIVLFITTGLAGTVISELAIFYAGIISSFGSYYIGKKKGEQKKDK